MSLIAGKALLTLVAITTCIGPYAADWNETHVLNPRWPPHARFHNGQTMSFGLTLGLATLWHLWTPGYDSKVALAPAASKAIATQRYRFAALLAALYWITQASAEFYPGALCVDPEFGEGCPQHYLDSILLGLTTLGWVLGEWAPEAQNAHKKK